MQFLVRYRCHHLLVDAPNGTWEEAANKVASILGCDAERILFALDGHQLVASSPEPRELDTKQVDVMVTINGCCYADKLYHSSLAKARKHKLAHPLPPAFRGAKRPRYGNQQVVADVRASVADAASSLHFHVGQRMDRLEDMIAGPLGPGFLTFGDDAAPAGSLEGRDGAAPAGSLTNGDGAAPAGSLTHEVVAPGALAALSSVTPQMAAAARSVGQGASIYVAPAESSSSDEDQEDDGASSDASSGSPKGDKWDDFEKAAAGSSPKIEAAEVGAAATSSDTWAFVLQMDSAEDFIGMAASPQALNKPGTWPPTAEEFATATAEEKLKMYKVMYAALADHSHRMFVAAAERDIATAELIATRNRLKRMMEAADVQ